MTFILTSPITGATQAGLTSPTYTLTADRAPDSNGVQSAVTALGGTQTGVLAHSVASPFTITGVKPKVLKTLGQPNPVTGVVKNVPRNQYKVITRKGVIPLVGQPAQVMLITTTIEVPAGADLADPLSVKAALSSHIGAVNQQSSGLGDMSVSGIL